MTTHLHLARNVNKKVFSRIPSISFHAIFQGDLLFQLPLLIQHCVSIRKKILLRYGAVSVSKRLQTIHRSLLHTEDGGRKLLRKSITICPLTMLFVPTDFNIHRCGAETLKHRTNLAPTNYFALVSVRRYLCCFFFFLYWRYNPLWVLAFSVIFFHSALSSHCFLHRLTPIICKSSSMLAIHLFPGLPLVLVPIVSTVIFS